ncbi:MAG: PaaI family thioesterase [Trinickia sp.]
MSVTAVRGEGALAIPLSLKERRLWCAHLSKMAILDHLGVRLDLDDEHAVRLTLVHRTPAHDGGLGSHALNGAMISGMIDCAMSIAGILHFRGRTCGTMHLSIQFMKAVREPHPVVECRAIRRAPSVVFVEARLLGRNRRCDVLATGMVGTTQSARDAGADAANWLAPAGMMEQEQEPQPAYDGMEPA